MALDPSLPGYTNPDRSLYNPLPLYKDMLGNNLINSTSNNAKKLSKESEATTSKQDAVIIQALPGVSIQVLFEFPANDYQSSVYFLAAYSATFPNPCRLAVVLSGLIFILSSKPCNT